MKNGPLRTALTICWQIAVILALVMLSPPLEAADKEVRKEPRIQQPSYAVLESEGLVYVYTMSKEPTLKGYDLSPGLGRITVSESRTVESIVFEEKYTSIPGCDKFPTLSRFRTKAPVGAEWFVVACGSDEGRHETIKAFLKGFTALDIRTTSLDFGTSFPNLTYDSPHGFYTARVYRRMFMDPVGYGIIEYATAYRLLMDDTVFSFIPLFGAPAEEFYFDYYLQLRDEVEQRKGGSIKKPGEEDDTLLQHYFGPMLAALAATEDANRICPEMGMFKSLGLTSEDLDAWRKRLVSAGYPDFDFTTCKEVAK